jgi:hypothetical protein
MQSKPASPAAVPDNPTSKPAPLGAIDFEVTDFDEARKALDELPAGVAEMQRINQGGGNWYAQRRKPLPSDRALTGAAMDWVVSLPPSLRPHTSCEQFARVVNAVADSWSDPTFSVRVLEHMIKDYRGGRRGFPASVQQELEALYQHQLSRLRR